MAWTRYVVLTAMGIGLGIGALGLPCRAQSSDDESGVTNYNKEDSQYELIDVERQGQDKGLLAEKRSPEIKEQIGDRDPDSTYLLQDLDSENELARK